MSEHPLFSGELSSWSNGATDEYLAEEMVALINAIKETQLPGAIQLVVKFEPVIEGPAEKLEVVAVDVQPEITIKVPRKKQAKSRRYPNEAGELERVDPRVPDMFPDGEMH